MASRFVSSQDQTINELFQITTDLMVLFTEQDKALEHHDLIRKGVIAPDEPEPISRPVVMGRFHRVWSRWDELRRTTGRRGNLCDAQGRPFDARKYNPDDSGPSVDEVY